MVSTATAVEAVLYLCEEDRKAAAMTDALLSELLIVDLSNGIAGAYCCLLFGHLGAEVVRVDAPNSPQPEKAGLDAGKKSITLDPSTPGGATLLRRLAEHADVLVVDEALPAGLDYAALSRQNPRLILTRIANSSSGEFAACFAGLNAFAATMLPLVNMAILGRGQEVEVDGGECLAAAAFVVDGMEAEGRPPAGEGSGSLRPPPFSMLGLAPLAPAASPGEHNDEVYCGLLGLSDEELGRLREASII